jgi:phage gp36-like protein
MAYVDAGYVKLVGIMPATDVDELEALYPGIVGAVAEQVSRIFDARLAKRYATPFAAPVPEVLRAHVCSVVVARLYERRGYNPGSAQDEIIQRSKVEALEWLKEAADSEKGLVELPIRELVPTADTSGVDRGAPLGYAEASPYAWTDVQAEDVRG